MSDMFPFVIASGVASLSPSKRFCRFSAIETKGKSFLNTRKTAEPTELGLPTNVGQFELLRHADRVIHQILWKANLKFVENHV